MARAVSDLAGRDAVFTIDTGLNTLWSANWIRQSGSQRIIGSFNNAAVGTALGQANSIQALDRSRQIIALCGDGGFNMLMCEFLTAVHHKLPVKVIMPYDDPHWMGGIGMIGTKADYNAIMHCDMLLVLGSDYPFSEYLPGKGSVIQVDERPEALGRRTPTALGILGSVRPTLPLSTRQSRSQKRYGVLGPGDQRAPPVGRPPAPQRTTTLPAASNRRAMSATSASLGANSDLGFNVATLETGPSALAPMTSCGSVRWATPRPA